jgi:trigger factor
MEEEPKLDLENDLKFSGIYDVLPEVKVEKWQGLEAEIPDVSIRDEDLNRELEHIREHNSIVLDKNEGESATEGDVLTVNYCELDESGETLSGSEREDFTFTLGSSNNIYQFDDEVKGMKKGETKEFSKTYAEDHKDYPGQTKKIRVSLTALKIKKLPELDDELAQDVDEKYNTLEDLKNSVRERLNKDLERRLREIKINKLLEIIMEKTPVEIPESMMRIELDSRWRNLARRFNTDTNGLYKMIGNEQAEAIINEWKPEAEKALHSRLIVETLIEELKLDANDEETEEELEKQAKESDASIEDIKKYYGEDQVMEYMKEDIKERKFFDMLLEKNTIRLGEKKSYIDLFSNIG